MLQKLQMLQMLAALGAVNRTYRQQKSWQALEGLGKQIFVAEDLSKDAHHLAEDDMSNSHMSNDLP